MRNLFQDMNTKTKHDIDSTNVNRKTYNFINYERLNLFQDFYTLEVAGNKFSMTINF